MRTHVVNLGLALLATVSALLLAEYGAGAWLARVPAAERMDSGLIEFDARLGWVLAAEWSGQHRHFDYAVSYTTNGARQRVSSTQSPAAHASIAVLGDSYTFGLGVDDDETFVARLNRERSPGAHLVNHAVPGYSTDQQLLLLERLLKRETPREVWLVVYLGNDLIDIARDYPLQAEYAKPRFGLEAGVLAEPAFPLSKARKPALLREQSLGQVLFDGLPVAAPAWRWQLAGTALGRLAGLSPPARSKTLLRDHLETRLSSEFDLFRALVQRMTRRLSGQSARLKMILIGGRSMLHDPAGESAVFQRYVAEKLCAMAAGLNIRCVDLDAAMQAAAKEPGLLYYPHDGHLTAIGHRVVAQALRRELLTASTAARQPQSSGVSVSEALVPGTRL